MPNYDLKCPECGGKMYSYERYYVKDKDSGKLIQVCKRCSNKRQIHRMFVKVQGKTRVID